MLKFIDLTTVLNEGKKAFAFYNRETGHFLGFFNREIFHSMDDFVNCLESEKDKNSELQIQDYIKLIPPNF